VKKILIIALAIVLLSLAACGMSTPNVPEKTPRLYISFISEDLLPQYVQVAQLMHDWDPGTTDRRGRFIGAYCASGEHPLDFWRESWECIDFSAFRFHLEATGVEIELQFSDDFPPHTVSARRWSAEFIGQVCDMQFRYEPVEINDNIIPVSDDGNDYIYEIDAIWEQGRSRYTFRLDSTR